MIDCRSEEGITVGLLDAIISIARIVSRRDLSSSNILEALKDLRSDEDVKRLMDTGSLMELVPYRSDRHIGHITETDW